MSTHISDSEFDEYVSDALPSERHAALEAHVLDCEVCAHKLYRHAKEQVERSLNFAFTGRKLKKRDFRSLWIVRIGAAARANGLSYSQFMHGLKLADIQLDRKVLADLAVHEPATFTELSGKVKEAIDSRRATAA